MNFKKLVVLLTVIFVLVGIGLLVNIFTGNPISERKAQREYLQYYEKTYNEKFIVYDSEYNFKIPDYIFEIGPQNNEAIRFDTALYSMGISDEYGGILAGKKLAEAVSSLLKEEYGYLNFAVEAKEDPLTEYGGEKPNYFETDPQSRISQNHFILTITWQTPGKSSKEYIEIFSGMAKLIEGKLSYKTPNLMLIMKVNDKIPGKGPVFEDNKFLFQTIP